MFITIGNTEYEFNPSLRTAKALAKRLDGNLSEFMTKMDSMPIDQAIVILQVALKDQSQAAALEDSLLDHCGLFDLYNALNRVMLEITYPGTVEEKERQIDATPMTGEQKNALRAALGLPLSAQLSSGNS